MTPRKKGTIMNSTMVLSTDTSGRTPRVDIGWPACDERLVSVAEATAADRGTARENPGQQSETSWGSANEEIAARRLPSLSGLREIPTPTVP